MSRFDLKQGELGNCWMVTAMAALVMDRQRMDKVRLNLESSFLYPSYRSFLLAKASRLITMGCSDSTSGALVKASTHSCMITLHPGEWVEVVVDDMLPVREGYVTPMVFAK
jgi:hypothetical protein